MTVPAHGTPAVDVFDVIRATIPGDEFIGLSHYGSSPGQLKSAWQLPTWAQRNALENAYKRRLWREADGVGIRLLTFTEDAVIELMAERRTGKVAEATHLLGLIADVDSNERRIRWPPESAEWDDDRIRWWYETDDDLSDLHDFRPYVPTITRALELATSVAPPTLAIDTGGGLACAWLLSEAVDVRVHGHRSLSRLSARWGAAVGDVVTAAGWYFDTPPGVGWLRLPGRRSRYAHWNGRFYDEHHVVALTISGPRYSLADIEAIAGPDDGEPVRSYSGSYWDAEPMTWIDGAPIPRPGRPGRPVPQPPVRGRRPQRRVRGPRRR